MSTRGVFIYGVDIGGEEVEKRGVCETDEEFLRRRAEGGGGRRRAAAAEGEFLTAAGCEWDDPVAGRSGR